MTTTQMPCSNTAALEQYERSEQIRESFSRFSLARKEAAKEATSAQAAIQEKVDDYMGQDKELVAEIITNSDTCHKIMANICETDCRKAFEKMTLADIKSLALNAYNLNKTTETIITDAVVDGRL